jgi:hypothetical protein
MTLTDSIIAEQVRESKRRLEHIAGLRGLADFLETHPNLPLPYAGAQNAFVHGKDELASVAREPGVKWQKKVDDYNFALAVEFPGGYAYEVNADRGAICRKVVTGTRIEPAREATPEREVETYEWVCDEPLLAGAK